MAVPAEAFVQQSSWANERLIEVCAQLTDEQLDTVSDGAFGSIRQTLIHMLSAEQYYLHRVGHPQSNESALVGAFPGFELLSQVARDSGTAFAAAATDPTEVVVEGTESDEFTSADATVFLVQAVNHSTEHRTQIMTMLTALGAGPADLDAQIDGWSWGDASGALRPKPA